MTPSQPDPLNQLAQEFLSAWRAAHGFQSGSASALTGENHLAILIEGAFSQAERKLAETQNGEVLLREYALELLQQICAEKQNLIHQATLREVSTSDVSVNLERDQVIFVFNLNGD